MQAVRSIFFRFPIHCQVPGHGSAASTRMLPPANGVSQRLRGEGEGEERAAMTPRIHPHLQGLWSGLGMSYLDLCVGENHLAPEGV